eukprot:TRINITY_DN10836_c0_g1_i1.p1 TRINITY_DN10836_c0_g1~~TRINITY_DN10836_c0_g1_i1.p1  ORF type:complete len:360 (+),score=60.92 TRINITY_DN10836_c0_g1_i1:97-1176(+)
MALVGSLEPSHRFAESGISPPEPERLTIGELHFRLLTAGKETDEDIQIYLSAGGVCYPNVQIPPDSLPPLSDGPIVAFAWHWRRQLCAVALSDDTIRFFDLSTEGWSDAVLSDAMMNNITEIAWQPMAGSILAVACTSGVLIWDLSDYLSKPRILNHGKYAPVSCMTWSPDGLYLAVAHDSINGASQQAATISIWEISLGKATYLQRFGRGLAYLSWSPNGCYLLAGYRNGTIRIWETKTWTTEKWSNFTGPCQSAVWSPNSKYVVVAIAGDSSFYCFYFANEPPRIGAQLVKINDFSEYTGEYESKSGTFRVGGLIKQIAWDPTGERFAVIFDEQAAGSAYVAIYAINTQSTIDFTPM